MSLSFMLHLFRLLLLLAYPHCHNSGGEECTKANQPSYIMTTKL